MFLRKRKTNKTGGGLNKVISIVMCILMIPWGISPAFADQIQKDGDNAAVTKDTEIIRIAGDDRYQTAIEISKQMYPQGSGIVVLARGNDFPDALAGVPLAHKFNAPLLLTDGKNLNKDTESEISRLNPQKIYILGGSVVIPETVENELKDKGLDVKRLGGSDRYATASLIARELGSSNGKAVIAYGENFPDALAVSSWAANHDVPILLTETNELPEATSKVLQDLKVNSTYLIGGKAVISEGIEQSLKQKNLNPTRYWGNDRYETAIAVAQGLKTDNDHLFVATGLNFPDALAGGVMAAQDNSTLLLVDTKISTAVSNYLSSIKDNINTVYFLGGKAVVTDGVLNSLKNLLINSLSLDWVNNSQSSVSKFDPGTQVSLEVNSNKSDAAFVWSVTGGSLANKIGPTNTWTLPKTPGEYVVTVTAQLGDKTNTVSRTIKVKSITNSSGGDGGSNDNDSSDDLTAEELEEVANHFQKNTSGDYEPPTIEITSPAEKPYNTSEQSLLITGKANDNSGTINLSCLVNEIAPYEVSGTEDWSTSEITLRAGQNTVTITATDAEFNTTSEAINIIYTPKDAEELLKVKNDEDDVDLDSAYIPDYEDPVTQTLDERKIAPLNVPDNDAIPSLTMTSASNINSSVSIEDIAGDTSLKPITSIVGHPIEITSTAVFESARLSFSISDSFLATNNLEDLAIAHYTTDNELIILDTSVDSGTQSIYADLEHFSKYFVINKKRLEYDWDTSNASSNVENGKADIVFVIDSTGSMGSAITNVKNNIVNFVNELTDKKVDARLGLVEFKDITSDGVDSTKNWGWFTDANDFKDKVSTIGASGGGDEPESDVDALEEARTMGYRSNVSKFIILITDTYYKEQTRFPGLTSMSQEIERVKSDKIITSVISSLYYEAYYDELYNETGGIFANLQNNFAASLSLLTDMIGLDVSGTGKWVRLSNGTVVKLSKEPNKSDLVTDTDEDGVPDSQELLEEKDFVLNGAYFKAWTFKSNPVVKDSDGDGLNDNVDPDPLVPFYSGITVTASPTEGYAGDTFDISATLKGSDKPQHLVLQFQKSNGDWIDTQEIYNTSYPYYNEDYVTKFQMDPEDSSELKYHKKIQAKEAGKDADGGIRKFRIVGLDVTGDEISRHFVSGTYTIKVYDPKMLLTTVGDNRLKSGQLYFDSLDPVRGVINLQSRLDSIKEISEREIKSAYYLLKGENEADWQMIGSSDDKGSNFQFTFDTSKGYKDGKYYLVVNGSNSTTKVPSTDKYICYGKPVLIEINNSTPVESSKFNRNDAYENISKYWNKVLPDGIFYTNAVKGQACTEYAAGTQYDNIKQNYVNAGVDCAHFVSFIIKKGFEKSGTKIRSNNNALGLFNYLRDSGLGEEVDIPDNLEVGDVVLFDEGSSYHIVVVSSAGKDGIKYSAHTNFRFDMPLSYAHYKKYYYHFNSDTDNDSSASESDDTSYGVTKVTSLEGLKELTDIDIIARVIYGEYTGSKSNATAAVAWTIENRHTVSGASYKSIVTDKNQYAACEAGNAWHPATGSTGWQNALRDSKDMVKNSLKNTPNPVGDSRYYRSSDMWLQPDRCFYLDGCMWLYSDKKWNKVKCYGNYGGNVFFVYDSSTPQSNENLSEIVPKAYNSAYIRLTSAEKAKLGHKLWWDHLDELKKAITTY